MCPAVNDSLREKLKSRQQSLSSGLIIDNKSFSRGVFRILRNFDQNEEPGYKYVSYYSESKKIGTTSPVSFGMKCPIDEYMSELKVSGSKVDNELAYKATKPSTEYWMAVLDMDRPGDTEKPGIRVFRCKRTLYDQILAQMLDADAGSDICDPEEGRDAVIKKEGVQKDTKWTVVWKSDSAVSEDADFCTAVREQANKLNVPAKFYAVDWDNLAAIYMDLTGDKMPDHYREQEGAEAEAEKPAKTAPKAQSKPSTKAPAPTKPAPKAKAPEPEQEAAGGEALHPDPASLGITIGTTKVTFVGEDEVRVEGKVVAHDAETGDYDVEDGTGEIWTMGVSDFEVMATKPAGAVRKKAGTKPEAPAAKASVPNKPASSGIRSRLAGK